MFGISQPGIQKTRSKRACGYEQCWLDSEINSTLGGLKRSHLVPLRSQRNFEFAHASGIVIPKLKSFKPEPNGETNHNIYREHPILDTFIKLRNLVPIQHHHTLSRENRTEKVGALLVLKVGIPGHVDVRGGKPNAAVERVGPNDVVVDLEPLVRVACCDVEYEVVAKGGVGSVIELREASVSDVESEGAGCDDDV
ncbi:hypothetical protein V8G54_029704 [Vigna mungo]|uniref:Uncharacterized protein n=1 Tax=Vigna mungo TaxID=3915 RepID=A0AAQ3MV64_VIGMU